MIRFDCFQNLQSPTPPTLQMLLPMAVLSSMQCSMRYLLGCSAQIWQPATSKYSPYMLCVQITSQSCPIQYKTCALSDLQCMGMHTEHRSTLSAASQDHCCRPMATETLAERHQLVLNKIRQLSSRPMVTLAALTHLKTWERAVPQEI